MSDEDEKAIVTLKEYVEARLQGMDRATEMARLSMEKRLDAMNEFRDTLRDQAATLVPRSEHDLLARQIEECRRVQAVQEGKASQLSVNLAYLISALSLAIAVIDLFKK